MMKVLVIGSGGREHALVWKLAQSHSVERLYAAPGNPGIWTLAERVQADHNGIDALADFAETAGVDLTVVGPETYLALGLVDEFKGRGLRVFGPTKAAAALEWDKAFAKDFMVRWDIPTADYATFDDYEAALAHLKRRGAPIVIKAHGLAAGKGAVVCASMDQAREALEEIMLRRSLGEAGDRVVIEEYMEGEEASFFVLTDGSTALPLLVAQDHKRAYDGDEGPNTGGMGAYAPAGVFSPPELAEVMDRIVGPTLRGMAAEGRPYRGLLYVGLMKTARGPRVVEFNSRFGDPETQAILPLLESDLAELCLAAADGALAGKEVSWSPGSAVCVALTSGGYPGRYRTGFVIDGLSEAAALDGVVVFHAGTSLRGGEVITAGGRVLNVTGIGPDFAAARERAYEGAARIRFEGLYYRRDIAWREMERS